MDCTSFVSYLSVILINNVGFSHHLFSIFASIKKKKDQSFIGFCFMF